MEYKGNETSAENTSFLPNVNMIKCTFRDKNKYTVYSVVYGMVFAIGLVTNTAALYIFCRLAKKKRVSTAFLMNLAIADLIFILTLPFRIFSYQTETSWPFLDVACRVSTYLFYMSMYCSIFFLASLGVCRYLVMAGRVKFQNELLYRWALALCFAVWIFIAAGVIIYASFSNGFRIEAGKCFEPAEPSSWELLYYMNFYALVIGFVIPFVILLICYALMIKHIAQTKTQKRRRDVAMICLVLTVFCICFLPYHVQRTLHLYYVVYHHDNCELLITLQKTVVATLCFAVANSCMDPLLFVFVGQGFLPMLKTLLRSCCLGFSNGTPISTSAATDNPENVITVATTEI
ncbi:lysophosphatidic acid receptor 6-like [Lepisosteus oculatus]|uniref:Lysophosphatidic acid receptor 6-like n=1 Tax=Lepisosteus oculatus TaxID=7918 RepID=W5NLH2_LEPOC|nr:PREDICTED: lysophosphatidic acid receptor 6-like [Lepisosteus oculatus]XP_015216187.1 PREDICTED: lysophosphatidic acid receptor 6-like [Lepisosteus oculatus]